MKKIIVSASLVVAAFATQAQSTTDPTVKLQVGGNARINGMLTVGSTSLGNDADGVLKCLTFNASIINQAGAQSKTLYENGYVGEFAFDKNAGALIYRKSTVSKNAGSTLLGTDLTYPFSITTEEAGTSNAYNKVMINGSLSAYPGINGDFFMWRRDGLDKTPNRALVNYYNDELWMNFGRDFAGGVRILGNTIFEDNVGIGIAPPKAKLHVANGNAIIEGTLMVGGTATVPVCSSVTGQPLKLLVQGIVGAKEFRCSLNNWCDYVFEPSYKLKPLAEVESYIQTNKHLPEVPSEKEVVDNGMEMGEMLKVHMKKIEELTLYVIEQNKRIQELEKAVSNK